MQIANHPVLSNAASNALLPRLASPRLELLVFDRFNRRRFSDGAMGELGEVVWGVRIGLVKSLPPQS